MTTPEVAIARLAGRQHGVVTQSQLIAAGLDRNAIAYRRRVGRLHLLHRGVYAVGHRPPSPLARANGADRADQDRLEGIHVHRCPHIDATTHYAIPVTTPLRTLVDLADVLTPNQLTRALNEAQVLRLVTPAELTPRATMSMTGVYRRSVTPRTQASAKRCSSGPVSRKT